VSGVAYKNSAAIFPLLLSHCFLGDAEGDPDLALALRAKMCCSGERIRSCTLGGLTHPVMALVSSSVGSDSHSKWVAPGSGKLPFRSARVPRPGETGKVSLKLRNWGKAGKALRPVHIPKDLSKINHHRASNFSLSCYF